MGTIRNVLIWLLLGIMPATACPYGTHPAHVGAVLDYHRCVRSVCAPGWVHNARGYCVHP